MKNILNVHLEMVGLHILTSQSIKWRVLTFLHPFVNVFHTHIISHFCLLRFVGSWHLAAFGGGMFISLRRNWWILGVSVIRWWIL